jgi:CRISPR/Cas system-associated protein Cas10 (large subunit of type III CRISPR-Cas system)
VPVNDHLEPEKRSIRTFAEIVKGTESEASGCGLATLRADIDDLAVLLKDGLPSRQFTLARLAHLSRHFNAYFVLFLGETIRKTPDFQDLFTVFAGGDDLFLIGSFDRILELTQVLKTTFGDFTSTNPAIHISAALTVHKPGAPMEALAGESMDELMKVKAEPGKNLLRILGEQMGWDQFDRMTKVAGRMEQWVSAGRMSGDEALALLEGARKSDPGEALAAVRGAAADKLAEMEISKITGWGVRYGSHLAIAGSILATRLRRRNKVS